MIFAVVPAAGSSRRMGRPKLELLVGGRPVLDRVIAALCDGGIELILVIVPPDAPEMSKLADAAGAHVYSLPAQTIDMRATVEHGLCWLEEHFHPKPDDAWLLAPADHPVLDAAVVRTLCEEFDARSAKSILVPVYDNRRGHPTLLAWSHVVALRALPRWQGIDVFLRMHSNETLEVAVADPGVLLDLDTPADYERLCALEST